MTGSRLRGGGLVLLSLFATLVAVGVGWRATVPAPAAEPARVEAAPVSRRPAVDPSAVSSFEVRPGWRAGQVALALDHAGLDGERLRQLVEESELEGYLFPGVYELRDGKTVEELVAEMTARFEEAFGPRLRERAREIGLSVHEVTTLASIVEREVARYSEAPIVAGVFTNRLRRGMRLKADPTVIYAHERDSGRRSYWTTSPSAGEGLQTDSPYNTYRFKGLPPGPIASPSREALLAALYPAQVEHLYFVAKATGAHDFSRTGSEHTRKAERYLGPERVEERRPRGRLQQFVERVLEPVDGHVGVYVRNLATGETAWLNPDEFFTAASLYKLAVLVTAFEHRERGLLSFGERLSITPAAAAEDNPRLRARLGRRPTVRKAIEQMIVVSSNAAGVTLLNRFGRDEVTRVIRKYGLDDTHLSERIVTTPRDVARLLEAIARGHAVSPRASREMLAILSRQEIRDRLPKYLPKSARLAHKTGTLDYPSHDAGVLFTPRGPVVVSALTENVGSRAVAPESLALLGRLVFDYYGELPRAQAAVGALRQRGCPGPAPARQAGPLASRTVVLDPGHGGRASGAVFNGLAEKDVVLDVALRLRRLLVARGATVYMTRCRDAFVSGLGRAALANAARPDAVVSIHLHGSEDPEDDGVQVGAPLPDGRVLARALLGSFAQPGLWDVLSERSPLPNRGERRRRSWLTLYSLRPAAIVEPVFLSNRDEARWLRRGSRRDEIARGLLRGLLNYFDVPEAPTARKARRRADRPLPPAGSVVRIAATGDIALGAPPLSTASPFAAVRGVLTGDVVLGNLEGTLSLGGVSKCAGGGYACSAFRTPPWSARWLAQAGFTVLNLANNHSNDYGRQGREETVLALDGEGLAHAGRPGQITRQTVRGVRVAVLGFAPYPSSGYLLDVERAARRVRAADKWADVVVVTMHAGGEGEDYEHVHPGPERFLGEERGDPIRFAHAVVDAGADLVVGHGPHVVRALEWYRGRLVAYSLGNFAGGRTLGIHGPLGAGAVLQATLRGDGTWGGGRIVPVRLAGFGDPRPDARGEALAAIRRLSRADFGRRGMRLASDGTLVSPRGP